MEEPTVQDALDRIYALEDKAVVFNNAIIALAILAGIQPKSFKYITAEDFADFVHKTMHPFAANFMDIAKQANKILAEKELMEDAGEPKTSNEEEADNSGGTTEPEGEDVRSGEADRRTERSADGSGDSSESTSQDAGQDNS